MPMLRRYDDVDWEGPIAQTPVQALDTLRRAKGMDGVC
jgi:hypothetical protein